MTTHDVTSAPTIRQQQTHLTRTAILDAAEELFFSDAEPKTITMQAIAEAAGVSHRTLYRHFETRDDLITGVGRRMDQLANENAGFADPADFDEWVSKVDQAVRFASVYREQLRRTLALAITGGVWRQDRDERYFAMFRKRFSNLDDETAREDFAALRHMLSASTVVTVGERFDLSPEQWANALQRSVAALVADIDERNRRAAG